MLNRYAEGSGTAAKFAKISDIKFLSATTLICSDTDNHCLRLLNLTGTMAETSTYAGNCTVAGAINGHRLHSALFSFQKYIEVDNYNSTIFVIDGSKMVRTINIITNEVTKLVQFGTNFRSMLLSGNSLLYFSSGQRITALNLDPRKYNAITGGSKLGKATGSFDNTRFDLARGLLLLSHEGRTLLLVADKRNNRYAGYSVVYIKFIIILYNHII